MGKKGGKNAAESKPFTGPSRSSRRQQNMQNPRRGTVTSCGPSLSLTTSLGVVIYAPAFHSVRSLTVSVTLGVCPGTRFARNAQGNTTRSKSDNSLQKPRVGCVK